MTCLVNQLEGSVDGIPHPAPDVIFQRHITLALRIHESIFVIRIPILNGLPDDGSSHINGDLSDVGQVGKKGGLGVREGRREGGKRIDTGHEHRVGNSLGSGKNGTKAEGRIDKSVIGLGNDVLRAKISMLLKKGDKKRRTFFAVAELNRREWRAGGDESTVFRPSESIGYQKISAGNLF